MTGVYLVCLTVLLSVLGTFGSPHTGKCKTEGINDVALDTKLIEGTWNIVYITETERGRDLDSAYHVITPTGENTYNLAGTKVLKDGTTYTQNYTLRIVDNRIHTETVENGKVAQYNLHPLAQIIDENDAKTIIAILFYHCSNTGTYPDDIRFVVVRKGKTPSDESMKQLLDADKSHNFKGNLTIVPNVQQ